MKHEMNVATNGKNENVVSHISTTHHALLVQSLSLITPVSHLTSYCLTACGGIRLDAWHRHI